MENSKKKSGRTRLIGISALILTVLFLIIYLITVISGSSEFFKESSEKNALICFEEDIQRAEALAEAHYQNLYEIAEAAKKLETDEAVDALIESYIGSEKFGDLRYYRDGKSYSANGTHVVEETSGKAHINAIVSKSERGSTPVYYDKSTQLDCIAFFVPINASEHIDGILSIVPARNIITIGDVINEKAEVVVIIEPNGKVLSDKLADGFGESVGNNFYSFIDKLTHNKTDSVLLSEAALKKEKTVCSINNEGLRYTLVMAPLSSFDENLLLISIGESEGLIAPELTYIRHIVNLLLISIAAIIIGVVYAILYHKKTKIALAEATLIDQKLDCPNAEQFKITAKYLSASIRRRYSIVALSIRNFIYYSEELGEEKLTELLKEIAKILQSLSNSDECYGYAGDGKFFVLMLNQNSHAVNDKIKLTETLINRNEIVAAKGMKLRLAAGVYNVFSGHRRSVQEMMDCAVTACGYAEDNIKTTYKLFTEEVRAEIAQNEKIEAMMESAMQNGDFRVFFQPKYDVKHDRIHSAEALVRWFDTEKGDYMFPSQFIPLFETNGFIVKLDHFVYIEVLEYLSSAAERGEKVVPIAVNVSRVTATSPDFINFYVGNKKKYGIPDGFITLELTESFAMEDYDKISTIITALHNSGMRCAIDDFGSGYSSFNILKQITVDELKLDSVFMKRGIDVQRDDKLLATIIDLAKSMGMSVVQEGVETKELFDKVIDMGCDIIQGYYYAKAISFEEFKMFINTNTSIKYKSLVK